MKTGIFGGTFNPPHMGHIEAAKCALKKGGLDRLILVPSNIPPHKILPENSASNEQRLFMAHLAAREIGCEVSAIELMREGKSYTKDTIAQLAALYPDDELFFIMGSDMLRTFESWYRPEEILRHCSLLALCRDESERQAMETYAENIRRNLHGKVTVIKNEVLTVSSTDIRNMTSRLVPKSIADYIDKNGLYGPSATADTTHPLKP